MAELGRAALVVSLGLSVYALVAGAIGARQNRRRLADSARNALFCCFGSTLVASAVLATALVRHDFSFVYVAQHTSRSLSTVYALSAFWGGQEGSLLLWLLVLTGYGTLAVVVNRRLLRDLIAWVVPVLGGIATFFAFVLVAVASPFDTQTAPRRRRRARREPAEPVHGRRTRRCCISATSGSRSRSRSLRGRCSPGSTDERWIVATRRWTLAAWTFLGFGQLLGAHWAYVEVGWGGYYAWDPVENAALMPWLAATAFLHSVMIQERKGMLKVWNMVLVALAFELSVFGTFLTRSGVVNSIHSFAKSPIGVVVPRVRRHLVALLGRGHPLAAPAAEGAHEARVGAVARGDVPLQQPPARRALPDDPLGRALADRDAARRRRDAHDRPAVLRLLPARVRPAAAAPDGDRAAGRLAEGERPRRWCACSPGRSGWRWCAGSGSSFARRRLVEAGADRLHVLGVRARDDRDRARPRHACRRARCSCSCRATGDATAATSCTRRSCCSRSAIAGSSAYGSVREQKLAPGPDR